MSENCLCLSNNLLGYPYFKNHLEFIDCLKFLIFQMVKTHIIIVATIRTPDLIT